MVAFAKPDVSARLADLREQSSALAWLHLVPQPGQIGRDEYLRRVMPVWDEINELVGGERTP